MFISWPIRQCRLSLSFIICIFSHTSQFFQAPHNTFFLWENTILVIGVCPYLVILYNWLIWRVLKLAFFFQKSIFPVFILASGAVRTTPSSCRHIFMRSLIWRWWAFAKKRQIKNHTKLTSYTVDSFAKVTQEWLQLAYITNWINYSTSLPRFFDFNFFSFLFWK